MKMASKTVKKILAILLIVFGGLSVVGGAVFSIGMTAAGWDFKALNTVKYTPYEYTETQANANISIQCGTTDTHVYFDEDATQVRIEYANKYTIKGKLLAEFTIEEENGSLTITQQSVSVFYMDFYTNKTPVLKIYLPKSNENYTLDLQTSTGDVEIKNSGTLQSLQVKIGTGDVDIQSLTCDDISITTNTGDVEINNLTCDALHISTNTGDVELGNLTGNRLSITTNTGDVESEDSTVLDFTNLQFKCGTGDVELRLAGTFLDYNVNVKCGTGNVYLAGTANPAAPKTLLIRTSTGDIRGVYVE